MHVCVYITMQGVTLLYYNTKQSNLGSFNTNNVLLIYKWYAYGNKRGSLEELCINAIGEIVFYNLGQIGATHDASIVVLKIKDTKRVKVNKTINMMKTTLTGLRWADQGF